MLRSLGAQLRLAGEALEAAAYKVGQPKGLPAVAAFRPAKTDFQTETQEWLYNKGVAEGKVDAAVVSVAAKFAAPSAAVSGDAQVADGAGVWYHAAAKGKVAVGPGSAVLEHAVLEGSSQAPTVLGAGVVVHPHSRVGAGVTVGDGAVIKSRAVVEGGASIGAGAVVGQGAVVASGAKVGAGELWAGAPAAKVGVVDAAAKAAAEDFAAALSEAGLFNATQHAKDIFEIHYERQALKDRGIWAEDVIEDHNNSPNGHLPIYLNTESFPDQSPHLRGELYNKGLDKGPEGNKPQPYPE